MKYLIFGLGNIGEEYANTRHNIGFVIADALAKDADAKFISKRYSDITTLKYRGKNLIVIKPATYMNNSGRAVRYWMKKENVPVEKILIIVDDIALPLGILRMRKKGGAGGHNGLISIIDHLGITEFPRLRVGIGNEFAQGYQVDYVLGKWTQEEEKIMIPRVDMAVQIVKDFVKHGVDWTMNEYNNK